MEGVKRGLVKGPYLVEIDARFKPANMPKHPCELTLQGYKVDEEEKKKVERTDSIGIPLEKALPVPAPSQKKKAPGEKEEKKEEKEKKEEVQYALDAEGYVIVEFENEKKKKKASEKQ